MGETYRWTTFFIDILGWSELVLRYNEIPKVAGDVDHVRRILRRAQRPQERLRFIVGRFHERSAPWDSQGPRLHRLAGNARAVFERISVPEMALETFGDSFIVNAPWRPDPALGEAVAAITPQTLFYQASFTMLMSLAIHLPLRGAIEMGWGSYYAPQGSSSRELITASVPMAFHLEQHEAKSVRVIVGPYVLDVLRKTAVRAGSDLENITGAAARATLEMCRVEPDGVTVLDYLSDGIVGQDGIANDADLVDMAYTFVDDALARARDARDPKLIAKYEPARRYFAERRGELASRRYPPAEDT